MDNNSIKVKNPQVFVCKVAKELKTVYPRERQIEIDNATNMQVKLEKYTAWQLLRYAFEEVEKIPFEMAWLIKNEKGKWVGNDYYFSISHSNGLCVVALDDNPIGVDVELAKRERFNHRLATRIANQEELLWATDSGQLPKALSDRVLKLWCKKEALFKLLDLPAFVPKKIDTTKHNFVCKPLIVDSLPYFVAVATNAPDVDVNIVEVK